MVQRTTFHRLPSLARESADIGPGLPRVELVRSLMPARPEHVRRCVVELKRALEYFQDATDGQVELPATWGLKLSNAALMGAQANIVHVPVSWLENRTDWGDITPEYLANCFVHEVVHGFTDAESFPMFLEFIHQLEAGNLRTLANAAAQYRRRDEPDQPMGGDDGEPYAQGYAQIARWIGCDPDELHRVMPEVPIAQLKRLFTAALVEYIREVPEEERIS